MTDTRENRMGRNLNVHAPLRDKSALAAMLLPFPRIAQFHNYIQPNLAFPLAPNA